VRKVFIAVAILLVLMIASPVQAQIGTSLSSVRIDILPEYDQPKVLVIYHISLPTDITLPTVLNLRIPADAEVYAVAIVDPVTAKLLNAPYDRSAAGTWANLAITVNARDVQVEFYQPLKKDGNARHIVFEWPGDYAVDAFAVALQQPTGATDLVTDPALETSANSQDGFVYYQSTPQAMEVGQTYVLTADYQKTTDALSTSGLPVQPTQSLDGNISGRVTMDSLLPWILAGIGGALVVVGIVGGLYLWKNGTRRSPAIRKRHSQRQQQTIDTGEVYCNQCGKRAQPGDVFCRACGMRLKKEE
jgi:hypothetical protein